MRILYTGEVCLDSKDTEEFKDITKMLGLSLPGGFNRVLKTGDAAPSSPAKSTGSSKRPRPEGEASPSKENKRLRAAPSAGSTATQRMQHHIQLTQRLKDAPAGTSTACTMPDCGLQVRRGFRWE